MKVILPGRPFPRPPSSVILFLMEYACGNISGAGGRTRTDMSSEARQILSLVRIPISPLRRVSHVIIEVESSTVKRFPGLFLQLFDRLTNTLRICCVGPEL